jgi:hypothetical protein
MYIIDYHIQTAAELVELPKQSKLYGQKILWLLPFFAQSLGRKGSRQLENTTSLREGVQREK